jgi:hypothetical protein
MIVTMNA